MGLNIAYEEGQTPLEQEELDALRVKTITLRSELDELEQQNIEKALQWTMRRNFSTATIFSGDFVFELHRRMFDDVWEWAGKQRTTGKNIGVDPSQIRIALSQLLQDSRYWVDHHTYPPDEIAVRFKHRIVNIHCFPNGNGRHSRLIADVIVVHALGGEHFTWGHGNLVRVGEPRERYLEAIRAADGGDIGPLLAFARS